MPPGDPERCVKKWRRRSQLVFASRFAKPDRHVLTTHTLRLAVLAGATHGETSSRRRRNSTRCVLLLTGAEKPRACRFPDLPISNQQLTDLKSTHVCCTRSRARGEASNASGGGEDMPAAAAAAGHTDANRRSPRPERTEQTRRRRRGSAARNSGHQQEASSDSSGQESERSTDESDNSAGGGRCTPSLLPLHTAVVRRCLTGRVLLLSGAAWSHQ